MSNPDHRCDQLVGLHGDAFGFVHEELPQLMASNGDHGCGNHFMFYPVWRGSDKVGKHMTDANYSK